MDEQKEQPAATEEEAALPPAEIEEELPQDNRIFGMRRRTFHLVVVGYALGIIAVSLLCVAKVLPEDTGTILPGSIGAALGYFLAWRLDKRDAAQSADKTEQP